MNGVKILVLANEYMSERLVTLCELYISKEVDRAIANGIEKADILTYLFIFYVSLFDYLVEINVVGLLLDAQSHNADQLAKFCLHFISTNFQPMKKRKEFSELGEENLKYVIYTFRK